MHFGVNIATIRCAMQALIFTVRGSIVVSSCYYGAQLTYVVTLHVSLGGEVVAYLPGVV